MEKKGLAWLAGETSGDFIASLVLPEVKAMYPDEPMFGIGGDKMIAAGLDAWHHSSVLAVRGYMEVLSRLPQLLMLRKRMIADVAKAAPRAFIGVDAPDFNLGIELSCVNKARRRSILSVRRFGLGVLNASIRSRRRSITC